MSRAVRPREAASLVLVRLAAAGPEVLMGRRPPRSAFAPDVFVFPGGSLQADDAALAHALDADCARRTARSPRRAAALARTALRETLEETGLTVTGARLTLIARAITPTNSAIRFHARFFHADAATAEGTLGGRRRARGPRLQASRRVAPPADHGRDRGRARRGAGQRRRAALTLPLHLPKRPGAPAPPVLTLSAR